MEKKVLSQEELQKLKDFQTREENLVIVLGQIAYQQETLEEQLEKTIEEKRNFEKQRSEFASSLTGKYGNGTIDIESGEITPTE